MVMAVNNSPLLGQVTDISGLADDFRDGQKLRQEFEARQQQKALNDLMSISDFNERLAAASQHKYAGALVPAVQKYEEARQKAALDNLKTSADIGKTFGETGKLNAETGKITSESEKTQFEIAKGVKDYISAAAVTQNPKVFGLQIGELKKRGLITDTQTAGLLNLVVSDPAAAAQVMQAMAMANPEIAKTFMPQFKTTDGGDKIYGYSVNPFTGEANEPSMTIDKGLSPDAEYQGQVSERNNMRTTNASMYSSDKRYESSVYATDQNNETQRFRIEQDGQIGWYNAETGRVNAETKRYEATNPQVKKTPKPASVLKMQNEYQERLKTNAATLTSISNWRKKIANGELKLGLASNVANSVANRTGVSGLGSNPAAYAEFDSFIKDLATRALRLNAGVQTDSDYARQLEAMVAGDYIPRNKETALALLDKMSRDFDTANKTAYNSLSNILQEYDGKLLKPYGSGAKKTPAKTAPSKKVATNKTTTQSKPKTTQQKQAQTQAIANKWFN